MFDTSLQHSGSDGWWFAPISVRPEQNVTFCVATNVGGTRGDEADNDARQAIQTLELEQARLSPAKPVLHDDDRLDSRQAGVQAAAVAPGHPQAIARSLK